MLLDGRPTRAEINLDALGFNLQNVQERGEKAEILAVVKADAYGHGAVMISSELESGGLKFFGVATCKEGRKLREAGIKGSIVILGGIYRGEAKEVVKYDLTPVIYTFKPVRELSKEAEKSKKKVKVQVKIDTGMGRIGILPREVEGFFLEMKSLENIEVEGLLSHLAVADREEAEYQEFTLQQLENFRGAIKKINDLGFHPQLRHIANSAGIVSYPSSLFNLIRPGLMLYGSYPSSKLKEKISLKPVMSLKTEVIQLKRVPENFSISYGRSYITKGESLIATLPIGYADGYPRALSNRGEVLIKGKRAPVVGVVCMDMVMVDVTNVSKVKIGEEVVLLGSQGEETISAEEIAEKIGTISYEIFCGISKRVPRVYLKERKAAGYDN
jgi:alanine racemase